jgi:hypothetical protein
MEQVLYDTVIAQKEGTSWNKKHFAAVELGRGGTFSDYWNSCNLSAKIV